MLRTIIVDDEERARNGLKKMLEKYCPQVKVVGLADSVAKGVQTIKTLQPQLVFLDIDMPDGDGFELLERVGNIDFEIIFATAYDQFALKAFKVAAIDYLVKPIDLDDLIKSIEKVQHKLLPTEKRNLQLNVLRESLSAQRFNKLALPSNEGLVFVNIDDIIRFEADGSYTMIYTIQGDKIMVTRLLGEYEQLLEQRGFFRTHHSHLINLNYIKKYVKGRGGYIVMTDGASVDVSVRKKEEFMDLLKGV
ncbi:MAG: LytTR family DNA-binding domain-containing protein [Chitinophagales bacterium]|nr:LytTR family DNA-binding domain-containing protein [Chitinophagales bacterium]